MSTEDFATAPDEAVKETTTATFRADVMEASLRRPVLVDFWAPWCGPCKQLAPILERVVRATKGKAALVKMNIDEHPDIAGQLGIASIPAVIAFQRGRPVDGFVGAMPEGQIRGFSERLVGPVEADGGDTLAEAPPPQAPFRRRRESRPPRARDGFRGGAALCDRHRRLRSLDSGAPARLRRFPLDS